MPSFPKVDRALAHFRAAAAAGRIPHALLVAGPPRGAGLRFAEAVLGLLFPDAAPGRLREQVDIQWIEPEGKARQIRIEFIRELISFIGLTSYQGGWKAGVVLFAERLNPHAQNALLKTLEEPPPRSLLILVTDTPAALLPTIRSRAQFMEVQEDPGVADTPWRPAVLDLLRNPPARQGADLISWADRLAAPLRTLEELAEEEETAREEARARSHRGEAAELTRAAKDVVEGRVAARVKEMREEILRMIQLWQRDVLARVAGAEARPASFPDEQGAIAAQADGLTPAEAVARVAALDEVRELLEHNIRDAAALPRLARALSRPVRT